MNLRPWSMSKNSRPGGFTLIEVLIALTILAVGFLAVAKMQITGLVGNRHAMELTEGVTWAQDRIEVLMGLPFNDPDLADTTGLDPPLRTDPNPPAGFTVTWTVTPDQPIAGAKQIALTTNWTDRFGNAKTVRLVGVKSNI